MSGRVPAILRSIMPPGLVVFDLNPVEIGMTRVADTLNRGSASQNCGSPGGASGSVLRRAPAAQITLKNVIFHGLDTKPRCDQLLNWMTPGGGLLGAAMEGIASAVGLKLNLASRLPLVTFQWGPPGVGFHYDVIVHQCTIRYLRFNLAGSPVRASVSLVLRQQPSLLSVLATNPTSGGLPGRRSHTVTAGQCLAGIAADAYGQPGRWRQIARHNGIEDPLRVRAGDRLFLPHPDEPAPTDGGRP